MEIRICLAEYREHLTDSDVADKAGLKDSDRVPLFDFITVLIRIASLERVYTHDIAIGQGTVGRGSHVRWWNDMTIIPGHPFERQIAQKRKASWQGWYM